MRGDGYPKCALTLACEKNGQIGESRCMNIQLASGKRKELGIRVDSECTQAFTRAEECGVKIWVRVVLKAPKKLRGILQPSKRKLKQWAQHEAKAVA